MPKNKGIEAKNISDLFCTFFNDNTPIELSTAPEAKLALAEKHIVIID
jgi:hypothetical protein